MKKIVSVLATMVLCFQTFAGHIIETTNQTLTPNQSTYNELIKSTEDFDLYTIVKVSTLVSSQEDGKVTILLPGEYNTSITYVVNDMYYNDDANYYWNGICYDEGTNFQSSLSITNKNGTFTGSFSIGEKSYLLEDLGDGLGVVQRYHQSSDNLDFCASRNQPNEITVLNENNICLLQKIRAVIFVDNTINHSSAAKIAKAQACINDANTTRHNSPGLHTDIELAGVFGTNFNFTSNIFNDINTFQNNGTTPGNAIFNARASTNADLTFVLSKKLWISGGSSILGIVHDFMGFNSAFSIVRFNNAVQTNKPVFSHECHHLFDCQHEVGASSLAPLYARGFQINSSATTLMVASNNVRNTLSNPFTLFPSNGNLLPMGNPATADNAREAANRNIPVALYFPDNIPMPVGITLAKGYVYCSKQNTITTNIDVCDGGSVLLKYYVSNDGINWSLLTSITTSNSSHTQSIIMNPYYSPSIGVYYYKYVKVVASHGVLSDTKTTLLTSYCPDKNIIVGNNGQKVASSAQQNVIVYPNPSTDGLFTIECPTFEQSIKITVTDPLGKILQNITYNDEQKIVLNLSEFSAGQYFLKLKTNKYEKDIILNR
jgi:hypothetical protein